MFTCICNVFFILIFCVFVALGLFQNFLKFDYEFLLGDLSQNFARNVKNQNFQFIAE